MTDFVFIDSGVGGIPYMTSLLEKSPDSSCIYVADTANFPYGEKNHRQITGCVSNLVKNIREKLEPRVIVIACNTMSVNALEQLRSENPELQFVGTVPAIKLAASVSKKRRIGLLATRATCENPYNLELKQKFAEDCELVCRGDGELVSYIEHNAFTATREECLEAVKPAVDFFRKNDCDVIILGCTHFLNIRGIFKDVCEPDITVVDSVDGVVRHSLAVLQENASGDFKGEVPLRRGGSARPDKGLGEGETYPSLYVTGIKDEEENHQFTELCARFGIKFMGNL